MAQFTKEQIERLKPYEDHFRRAYFSHYSYGVLPSDLAGMKAVYDEATHPHSDAILRETCGVCIFNFVNEVATIYYQSIDELERAAKERKRERAKELRAQRRMEAGCDA